MYGSSQPGPACTTAAGGHCARTTPAGFAPQPSPDETQFSALRQRKVRAEPADRPWEHQHRGVDPRKLRDVTDWRTSTVYTSLERAVMEYAAAATATPAAVTDDMVAVLQKDLDDAQIVELATLVSLENLRSRTNAGLGLTSQGFTADCAVPARDSS